MYLDSHDAFAALDISAAPVDEVQSVLDRRDPRPASVLPLRAGFTVKACFCAYSRLGKHPS